MGLEQYSVFERENEGWLYNGDCLEILRYLDDNSIDAVVTDPP